MNDISFDSRCQLQDVVGKKKRNPWRQKKLRNLLLANSYDSFNPQKALRLRLCNPWLTFRERENGSKKLAAAMFCHVRLCPTCTWRRSLKLLHHSNRIMITMSEIGGFAYIFVTLTARNCPGEELTSLLDRMMLGWNRMTHYDAFRRVVKGSYRGLEITHNVESGSESFDTFHPHFHCIFAVNKSYFTSKNYLSQEAWTSLWQKAMKLDYKPLVDVRKVKGDTIKAVAEAVKYTVKDTDYIFPEDLDLSNKTVQILDAALDHRRLVAFGGIMKELHKKLNLDDEIDGDLVVTDQEKLDAEEIGFHLVRYIWGVGYFGPNYYKALDQN